jgi:predicted RNA-binding Zn-ribbon protein involved in translation (DUF1610 family)
MKCSYCNEEMVETNREVKGSKEIVTYECPNCGAKEAEVE